MEVQIFIAGFRRLRRTLQVLRLSAILRSVLNKWEGTGSFSIFGFCKLVVADQNHNIFTENMSVQVHLTMIVEVSRDPLFN